MRNNRMMTGAICGVLLGAMVAFHAYCDTTAANESAQTLTTIAAEAAESSEESSAETTKTSGTAGRTADAETDSQSADSSAGASNGETSSTASGSTASESTKGSLSTTGGSALDTSDLFSDRDLEQTADLAGATHVTLSDGETVTVKTAGVYVLTGTASNAQILVEVGDEDKVQLVLDGVTMTNDSTPCIYVKNADKVFVTTTDSENTLTVTGTFTADGTTNTDAVIFSRDDLVLNGTGTLNVSSTDNGITSKDDLKITGGTINVTCASDALEANDSIRIADGTISLKTSKDGLHAENDEDNTLGFIYIGGGTITIDAGDDAVHATTIAQIDDGTIDLTGAEGIEGTYIQINGGTVAIAASDDGINAGRKSDISTPAVEINGGEITITMGAGDTDGVDSNGNLILNGGTLDITAQSPFDYDGTAENNGTKLIVNGTQTDTITNQMMGGGFGGGRAGGKDGQSMPDMQQNGETQGNFKRGGAADGSGSSGQMPQGGPGGQMPHGGPDSQMPQGGPGGQMPHGGPGGGRNSGFPGGKHNKDGAFPDGKMPDGGKASENSTDSGEQSDSAVQ